MASTHRSQADWTQYQDMWEPDEHVPVFGFKVLCYFDKETGEQSLSILSEGDRITMFTAVGVLEAAKLELFYDQATKMMEEDDDD